MAGWSKNTQVELRTLLRALGQATDKFLGFALRMVKMEVFLEGKTGGGETEHELLRKIDQEAEIERLDAQHQSQLPFIGFSQRDQMFTPCVRCRILP